MNISKFNNWFTLLANVGVIAGILFLAYEIRQNTTSLQAAAIQASTEVARENIMTLVNDPSLLELKNKAPSELSIVEEQRLSWLSRSFWLSMQGLWRQWQLGILPEEEWLVWQGIICGNMTTNNGLSGRVFWERSRGGLIPEFVALSESSCVDTP
jgi:hypothetical protein